MSFRQINFFPILLGTFFFLFSKPTHAGLFDSLFATVRPACVPVAADQYNPDAYNQIENPDNDCSVYGFDFFANDLIEKTSVTCGDPVQAVFNFFGEDITDNQVTFNGDLTVSTDGITGISMTNEDRVSTPTWKRLVEEAGSLFTNVRSNTTETLRYVNYGFNAKTLSSASQVRQKFEYCQFLLDCQNNNNADLNELRQACIPTKRCVNPMPYDIYPQDPNRTEVAMENVVCREALDKLSPLNDPNDFFTDPLNWASERDFITKFMALDPTFKARELMVVCTDTHPDANAGWLAQLIALSSFDCQEIIIPPGLVSACQGITNQVLASLPARSGEELTQAMCDLDHPLGNANGQVVTYLGSGRLAQYARRINGENKQCLSPTTNDTEQFGANNQDIVTSGTINYNASVRVDEPNADESFSYSARRTFIIAPPGFDICLNQLAKESPESLANLLTNSQYFRSPESGDDRPNMPHSLGILERSHSAERCSEEYDDQGNAILGPNGRPILNCHNYELNYNPETTPTDSVKTPGGFLGRYGLVITSFFKAFFDPSNSNDRTCGWEEYKLGLPAPAGCSLTSSQTTGITGACWNGNMSSLINSGCSISATNMQRFNIPPLMKAIIEHAGSTYNVPPDLIVGLMFSEGGFEREACYGEFTDAMIREASICGGSGLPNCRECNYLQHDSGFCAAAYGDPAAESAGVYQNLVCRADPNRIDPCNFYGTTMTVAAKASRDTVGLAVSEYPRSGDGSTSCEGTSYNFLDINGNTPPISCQKSYWTCSDVVTAIRFFKGSCFPESQAHVLSAYGSCQ